MTQNRSFSAASKVARPKDRFGGVLDHLVDRLDIEAGELTEKVDATRGFSMRDLMGVLRANRPSG